MGYKEIPGGVEALAHEDGKFRIGLRNLPQDSDRFIFETDEKGQKLNEWPTFVIRKPFNGPERRALLPEAVLKAHGKIPPNANCVAEDFESKSGSKVKLSDSRIDNIVYKPAAEGNSPYKKAPVTAKDNATDTNGPEPDVESHDADADSDSTPDAPITEDSTKVANEGEAMSDIAKGSAELTAKKAIEIIEKFDFEELRDLNFYTEEDRDRGPRVTVKEAWEQKKEAFES